MVGLYQPTVRGRCAGMSGWQWRRRVRGADTHGQRAHSSLGTPNGTPILWRREPTSCRSCSSSRPWNSRTWSRQASKSNSKTAARRTWGSTTSCRGIDSIGRRRSHLRTGARGALGVGRRGRRGRRGGSRRRGSSRGRRPRGRFIPAHSAGVTCAGRPRVVGLYQPTVRGRCAGMSGWQWRRRVRGADTHGQRAPPAP